MRFYHMLASLALLSLAGAARAQPARPPVPAEQDVDDDEAPPAQPMAPPSQRMAPPPQADDGMPPPDPRAYAQSPQYGFMGPHPIPYEVGSGFCYQEGAHFHPYAPFDRYLFRESNGWFYFVGDAGDFGYTQQLWGYRGHHPIAAGYGGGYCFIDWPHRHHYPPPATVQFNLVGGYYVYGGAWDPWYWQYRNEYVGYYGGYYRRSYYGGVYWTARPAPIYRPGVVIGAPGVYRPGALVAAPGGGSVRVVAAPGVVVGAPRAGVVVGAPRPGGVVVGAPRAGVVVGAPRPGGGAVVVGAPRPYAPASRAVSAPRPYAAPARSSAPGGFRRR